MLKTARYLGYFATCLSRTGSAEHGRADPRLSCLMISNPSTFGPDFSPVEIG